MHINNGMMVEAEDLQCLKAIALMGGCRGMVGISSQSLGNTLSMSPQTASRRLISLESQGLIARTVKPDGQYIMVTKEGEEDLRREYADYFRIFEDLAGRYVMEGVVIDGLGEGRYYVGMPGYQEQFETKLGFSPFHGTLNLQLTPESVQVRRRLDALAWVDIEGFVADKRTFGAARCLPCSIEGHPCAIIVPGRTHYPDNVIELISPVEIRNVMGIKTGDQLIVEVDHD
jgi:riboflavin kinase